MKTKHLFLATALVASFASCTNEEIVEMQQGVVDRPSVDNVQLNFVADGVDSRLTFGSNGYAWEADDVIGALNMDTYDGSKTTWSEKYPFTTWVNTSYPFTYDAEEGTWETIGKMLEGNYFFTFPWSDFNGERTPVYALTAQQQNGVKGAAVAQSYAENQVFVGYSPILKGKGFDVLTDVEMTSLLGAVQLRIKNAGDKTYHISKVVVKGAKVSSTLTVDPTQTDPDFAVADYLGKDFNGLTVSSNVKNLEEEDFAEYRMAALRNVAKYSTVTGGEFVQLHVNGTEAERAVAPGATAYALIMVNPIEFFNLDSDGEYITNVAGKSTLTLDIYTDEGIITGVNLINPELSTPVTQPNGVELDGTVKSTVPGVANTVVVSFEDIAVKENTGLNIYTEADMLQLINWNINKTKKTTITATLQEDVELTKEAFNILKSNELLTLKIEGTKSLTLAEDLSADVLNYKGLSIATAVKVAGEVTLAKETINLTSIEVLEGAVLNINVLNANVPATVVIAEGAELNIGAAAKTSNTVAITNNGKMNVAAGALVQGAVTNNGELNLNGTANRVLNEGIVKMGATSKLLSGTNSNATNKDAVINMVSGATLSNINNGTNETAGGRVKYVDGAIITHTGTTTKTSTVNCTVFVEVGGADATVAADTYKNKGVNLWQLVGNINVTAGVTLTNVEIAEEKTIEISVAADSTLTVSNLTVLENAAVSTNGKFKFANVTVKKDAEWTNNGGVVVTTKIDNQGSIYNNGEVKHGGAPVTLTGVGYALESSSVSNDKWSNNLFLQFFTPSRSTKQQKMDEAVTRWMQDWNVWYGSELYNGNPYDYAAFVSALTGTGALADHKAALLEAGFTAAAWTATDGKYTAEPAEFASAVAYVLDSAAETAATTALILPSTDDNAGQFTVKARSLLSRNITYVFEDAAEIDDYVALQFNSANSITELFAGNYKNAAATWDLTLTTAITTTPATKYYFVSEDDTIYTVARLWKKHSARIEGEKYGYVEGQGNEESNTVARLQAFINELSNITSSNKTEAHSDAITAFSEYKEYILGLNKDASYSPKQISICAEFDETAERVQYQFSF